VIQNYSGISPKADLILLQTLANKLRDKTLLHVNSTKAGGGVAEILQRMTPILQGLGIDTRWEIILGDERFFEITKKIHNALQGNEESISSEMWEHYHSINQQNGERLNLDADCVFIHDPQPAPLYEFRERGTWVFRCHIDVSNPLKSVYDQLARYCGGYHGIIFSVARFARAMGIDEFIIPPSIDPLSDKNRELTGEEIAEVMERLQIPLDRPIVLQVSRFDRFKDPIGVIKAFRMVKKYHDCLLILAGSPATDDPEGQEVLDEVKGFAADDGDIRILLLPPFSDRDINALQRVATVVLQKSLKEGFGLTVSEAMWKGKPVVGGAVGGIPLQIIHGVTGFLVHSREGAAFRIRQLLSNPDMATAMGEKAREFVRANFLITRETRDYLSVWYALENRDQSILML
jgi:trehalose synthase